MQSQITSIHSRPSEDSAAVARQLRFTDRALMQLATAAIRKDPIKSLVELVTNSDDSYRRLEFVGASSNGRIIIKLDRQACSVSILDYAEGLDARRMDECVGTYGADVSGFDAGYAVRGFYGRGLKDAILGLGSGTVRSIKNKVYYQSSLDEGGYYFRAEPRRAIIFDYVELGIPHSSNGTSITVELRNTSEMPRFEWVKLGLSHHTSLRDIIRSEKRRVILTEGDRSEILTYRSTSGELVLEKRAIPIPGYSATLDLTVSRAEKPLTQEGYTRDGGLLIRSRNAIHGATLFKFEHNPYATRFFGELRCNYIDDLMKQGDLVVDDKRDGLDLHHPFTKTLKKVAEEELQRLVDIEMNLEERDVEIATPDLKARFDTVLWQMNKLATRLNRETLRRGYLPGLPRTRSPIASVHTGNRGKRDQQIGYANCYSPILFTGIRLNPKQDPKLRAFFDKNTGIINIATRAPSVAMYSKMDNPAERSALLVLIAELISDTMCLELASLLDKDQSDVTPEMHQDLKSRFSHLIHRAMQNYQA